MFIITIGNEKNLDQLIEKRFTGLKRGLPHALCFGRTQAGRFGARYPVGTAGSAARTASPIVHSRRVTAATNHLQGLPSSIQRCVDREIYGGLPLAVASGARPASTAAADRRRQRGKEQGQGNGPRAPRDLVRIIRSSNACEVS